MFNPPNMLICDITKTNSPFGGIMSTKKPSWSSHCSIKSFATSIGDELTTFLLDDFIDIRYNENTNKQPTLRVMLQTLKLTFFDFKNVIVH